MSTIGNLVLGSLVSKGADRLLDRDKFTKNQFDILTGGGITGQGDEEEKDTRSKTLGGIAKTGIMSLIANALFGPIFAPLAMNLGQRFVDRRRQGLGFFEQPGDTTQPEDPRGTFTAEGMQFANIQDSLGSTDPNKDINYDTGVITDKTTGKEVGNVYDEVALITDPPAYDFDDSSSDSGGGGGSSSASTAGDAPDYSGPSPFRYGGLASLYR